MSAELDTAIESLRAKVEANTSVGSSVLALINGFPAILATAVAEAAAAAGVRPDQLQAITDVGDTLVVESQAFVDAVAANTPPVPSSTGRRP